LKTNVLCQGAAASRELGAGRAKEIPVIDPLETVARKLDLPTATGTARSARDRNDIRRR
jgi:hypothetical protein